MVAACNIGRVAQYIFLVRFFRITIIYTDSKKEFVDFLFLDKKFAKTLLRNCNRLGRGLGVVRERERVPKFQGMPIHCRNAAGVSYLTIEIHIPCEKSLLYFLQ